MAARIGVLLIHGMGNPEFSYAERVVSGLAERLGASASAFAFEACYWSPLLQRQQDVTWQRLRASGRLRKRLARRWIVSALGDPVSYLAGYLNGGAPAYHAIHECVRASLTQLERRLGRPDAPLVVLAHSLGGVIISNYIWNEQRVAGTVAPVGPSRVPPAAPASARTQAVGQTPFERMETLSTLVTYGCNIPLFLPPSPPIECIRFPPPQLGTPLREAARWMNVYDPDDLLGFPIAQIWDDDKGTRIEDLPLEVGAWPVSASPLSHVMYARDAGFLRLVANQLRAVDDAAQPIPRTSEAGADGAGHGHTEGA